MLFLRLAARWLGEVDIHFDAEVLVGRYPFFLRLDLLGLDFLILQMERHRYSVKGMTKKISGGSY